MLFLLVLVISELMLIRALVADFSGINWSVVLLEISLDIG
ncbi:hypothetical protein CRENPOLYSF2_2560027 [Crenothrix polyspora]|uniref:Uncharacterized protein n=1 Tax=Crenothrix polyspora TaxID=360316 RepID=A0A1R4H7J0_9GAMM|nr:hypothetical protein CRENPOLYSF2_2560027 [Crenothrix polyspora]